MKFLSWNLRGLNNTQKQYALNQCIFQEKVDCVLIQETKMSSANFDRIVSHVWPGASYMHMDADGASGGISIMWNQCSMMGVEIWRDKNFIIIEFETSNQNWGLINIYASNNKVGRRETYGKMERIIETMKDKQLMCMGDFNTHPLSLKEVRRK